MNATFIAAAIAAAIVAPAISSPRGSGHLGAPETIYLDLPHHGAFTVSNGSDRSFSTRKPPRRRAGQRGGDSYGGSVRPCGAARLLCYDGLVTLAVDQAALDDNKTYEAADVEFAPTCLYRPAARRCGLAVIKYGGKTGSSNEGNSGLFVYEAGFGVRLFAGVDPKTGEILGVFSYASGRPLLAK